MSNQYKQHTNPEPDDLARQLAAELPSPVFPYELKYVEVHGSKMAYVDEGEGDPIVFIHGAPESSYIWRNVMPYLEPYGRVMAPDLIGHGHSDKPDHLQYKFPDHVKYLDGWFKALNLKNVTLVGHDWGSILACYYAARKPDNVRGIAMMEALIMPFYPIKDTKQYAKDFPGKASAIEHYQEYRRPGAYEWTVVENGWIDEVLPMHIHRKMTQREMNYYRDPFRDPKLRKSLFPWACEVSLDGDAPFTDEAMEMYNKWLLEKEIPTLDIYGFPGEVTQEADVRWRTERMKNHETAFVGAQLHFIQEDQPEAVGRAIGEWYRRNLAPNPQVWMTPVTREEIYWRPRPKVTE